MSWSRDEVEAIVADYLSMLASELAGVPYNESAHRRTLQARLNSRSDQSIEFKHANISAILIEAGFPYINGYKPRSNYQALLADVLLERLANERQLRDILSADVERPMVVPEVDDILGILTKPPASREVSSRSAEPRRLRLTTDYLEREARNRSLGCAGELFTLHYERARLIRAGCESLADRVEHTAQVRGDHEGYDILSFEESGRERFIEVKTTKYGVYTPFFVSRNELETSERCAGQYHVYRLFQFRDTPQLYTMTGAIRKTCSLTATAFLAEPR